MARARAGLLAGWPVKETVRYVLGLALGVVILVVLFGRRGELEAAWRQFGRAEFGWVAGAIAAEAMSLCGYAWLQRRVLRLTGTLLPLPGLMLLALANDAIANTVPGEPAVSGAYRYRYYRRRGASGAGAGWAIFTIIIAQAIAMALFLLVAVAVALSASASAADAGPAALALVVVLGAGVILVRRNMVLRLAEAAVRRARRIAGRSPGGFAARVETTLARMREFAPSPAAMAGVIAIALAVWCSDFLCLACSFRAVHAPIPWHGALVAYGAAQVAGSLPVVPGGLGIVEGSLAVILAAYGVGRVTALSAVIAFRLVNFWLATVIGWISIGVIAVLERRRGVARPGAGVAQDERNAA